MPNSAPLWTKNFILVSAINFQLVLTFYLLVVVIVGYAVTELGASTAQAGLVSGLFIVGTLVGRLLVGQFLERFGRKITLLVGLIGFLLFSCLYFIRFDIGMLLFVRFMHGFMMGIASSVLGTIIAQIFLAIWMMLNIGYHAIFVVSSVIALSCLVVALFIQVANIMPAKVSKLNEAQAIDKQQNFISRFIEPKALPISMIMLLASICYSGVLSFINFYAKEINLVEAASFFFLMYAIAILISRPITGPLMDRKGANVIMYPAFMIMGGALFILSIAHSAWMLLLCAALLGFGYGNIQSICQTIAVKSCSIERMGFATSTFFIFLDAGLGFGPYFLGKLLDHLGYSQLYLYSAYAAFACIVAYYFVYGRHQRTQVISA